MSDVLTFLLKVYVLTTLLGAFVLMLAALIYYIAQGETWLLILIPLPLLLAAMVIDDMRG
jgi:hypothetical protein